MKQSYKGDFKKCEYLDEKIKLRENLQACALKIWGMGTIEAVQEVVNLNIYMAQVEWEIAHENLEAARQKLEQEEKNQNPHEIFGARLDVRRAKKDFAWQSRVLEKAKETKEEVVKLIQQLQESVEKERKELEAAQAENAQLRQDTQITQEEIEAIQSKISVLLYIMSNV